jgi:hypothetical protein
MSKHISLRLHLTGGAPLGTSASGGNRISSSGSTRLPTAPPAKHTVSWGSRKPLRKDASWFAVTIALLFAAATIYYLYVRIAFTLDMKDKW